MSPERKLEALKNRKESAITGGLWACSEMAHRQGLWCCLRVLPLIITFLPCHVYNLYFLSTSNLWDTLAAPLVLYWALGGSGLTLLVRRGNLIPLRARIKHSWGLLVIQCRRVLPLEPLISSGSFWCYYIQANARWADCPLENPLFHSVQKKPRKAIWLIQPIKWHLVKPDKRHD